MSTLQERAAKIEAQKEKQLAALKAKFEAKAAIIEAKQEQKVAKMQQKVNAKEAQKRILKSIKIVQKPNNLPLKNMLQLALTDIQNGDYEAALQGLNLLITPPNAE
jgi:hypothetical protein